MYPWGYIGLMKNFEPSITQKAYNKMLDTYLDSSEMMQELYELNTGKVYILTTISINDVSSKIDFYFKKNLQKYQTLYSNYIVAKNNNDINNILIN